MESEFKKWEDLMSCGNPELLKTELKFGGMDKGELNYDGEFKGKKVYCAVSETCISDYCYSDIETVGTATQGEYVYLSVDGKVVLNTH